MQVHIFRDLPLIIDFQGAIQSPSYDEVYLYGLVKYVGSRRVI